MALKSLAVYLFLAGIAVISLSASSSLYAQAAPSTIPTLAPRGGISPRPLKEQSTDAVNVKDFGATGDGVTDDSSSINSAIAFLRSARNIGGEIEGHLVFPQGRYIARSTINLTGIRSRYVEIDGQGAVIIGKTPGRPVVDALGARYLRIRDLSIEGDPVFVPSIGIQIGRIDDTLRDSSDNISLEGVFISGVFSFTALYNLNAETSKFDRVILWNSYPSATSFALVEDGLNHWHAHSAFIDEHAPQDTPQSFNENLFLNVDIRHFGGGTPIWMAQTSRHKYVDSYAANTSGVYGVELYSAASNDQNMMLDVDLHVETGSINFAIFLTGPNPQPILTGLKVREHNCSAKKSLIGVDVGIKAVRLRAAQIEIGGFSSPQATVLWHPEIWSGSADVTVPDAVFWNGPATIASSLTSSNTKSSYSSVGPSIQSILITAPVPKSAKQSCKEGQIAADDEFLYVCISRGNWKRTSLSEWNGDQ